MRPWHEICPRSIVARCFIALLIALFLGLCRVSVAFSSPEAEFPFELRNGLLWVRVNISCSAEPMNFLLDSGAGVSVVNLRTAKRLGVKLGERVTVQGVGSSSEGFWPQKLNATVGGRQLPKEYLAVDLGELSRACDCSIDGLVGADFFRGRVVQIDFNKRKIRLLSSSQVCSEDTVVQLRVRRGALLASVRVDDGKPQWMRVDTGCASALQCVLKGRKLEGHPTEMSVALAELTVPSTVVDLQLGSKTSISLPAGLHDRPIFFREFGLIGAGLLTRFEQVTIDTQSGKLILGALRTGF